MRFYYKIVSLCGIMILAFGVQAKPMYWLDLTKDTGQKGWSQGQWKWDASGLTVEIPQGTGSTRLAEYPVSPEKITGSAVLLEAEIRTEGISNDNMTYPYKGAKVQLYTENKNRKQFLDLPIAKGHCGWIKVSRYFTVMPEVDKAKLIVGLNGASGTLQLRNLAITQVGHPLDFSEKFNRPLADQTAGDKQGGWTDQGAENDGSMFANALSQQKFSDIYINSRHYGPSVCVMKSPHTADGIAELNVPVGGYNARSLFVLHTGAWIDASKNTPIGTIMVRGKGEKQHSFAVRSGVDLGDWHTPVQYPNAYPAVLGRDKSGMEKGIFLSRYPIPEDFGPIESVSFLPEGDGAWLILGATLREDNPPLPVYQKAKITAGKTWVPIKNMEKPIKNKSALDLSQNESINTTGRIVIDQNGDFVLADNPQKKVRFFSCVSTHVAQNFGTREAIDRYVAEIRKHGYNMVRFHFPENILSSRKKGELLEADALDRLDYLVFKLKENGIYVNLDLMASWAGYQPENPWSEKLNDPKLSFKYRMHFEDEIRKHWKDHTNALLNHVNPYTKLRWADDPAIATVLGFNEQEYGFWLAYDPERIAPHWRAFLKEKYKGDITAWNRNHSSEAQVKNFEEIPCFSMPGRTYNDDDAALFLRQAESNTLEFYRKSLQDIGYKGSFSAYNCGKNMYYNMVRKDLPVIMMNAYFAHPSGGWYSPGARINQNSSIGEFCRLFRDFMIVRQVGKPLMVTEYNIPFWNRYRYEQAFSLTALAAFQNFSALTIYAQPVCLREEKRLLPFSNNSDPIAKAAEFLSYFLYVRGDIMPATGGVRIRVSEEDVFKKGGLRGTLPMEASLASLMAKLTIECVPGGGKLLPLKKDEIAMTLTKTSPIFVGEGFSGSVDDVSPDASKMRKILRNAKILSATNRSDGATRFENSTGEIFVDTAKNLMQITTPKFQGICAEAGTAVTMPDFSVRKMSERGCLSLVAIDGDNPIFDARKLMLVYATNALNAGMEFSSPSMEVLQYMGDGPILLKNGVAEVSIRNRNAGKLRLFPLDMTGERLKEMAPSRVDGDTACFRIDTTSDGPTVFFEIAVKND